MRALAPLILAFGLAGLAPAAQAYHSCRDCGQVERIDSYREHGRTTGGGAVAGAVIGGVLGHQVGKGDGRKAATVVGAVGGGIAGNNIEKHNKSKTLYDVTVRMDDGRTIVTHQSHLDGIREGDTVRIINGDAERY